MTQFAFNPNLPEEFARQLRVVGALFGHEMIESDLVPVDQIWKFNIVMPWEVDDDG